MVLCPMFNGQIRVKLIQLIFSVCAEERGATSEKEDFTGGAIQTDPTNESSGRK